MEYAARGLCLHKLLSQSIVGDVAEVCSTWSEARRGLFSYQRSIGGAGHEGEICLPGRLSCYVWDLQALQSAELRVRIRVEAVHMAFNGAPQKEWQPDEEFGVPWESLESLPLQVDCVWTPPSIQALLGPPGIFDCLPGRIVFPTSLIYRSRLNINAWRSQ